MAGFRVDFGDCVFDCGGISGCYDKNTTGLGADDSEVLEFVLKDDLEGNLMEE
jgi:hypothetical protein